MSYGVALRNGVPFTLGTIAALCVNATTQWNPLRLWPNGASSPGLWISPRDLTSQWQDYTGTTPVSVPGTVADSSNPVGLALDIRAGALGTLGPELVVNGDFAAGATGWTLEGEWTVGSGQASITNASNVYVIYQSGLTAGKTYLASFTISSISAGRLSFYCGGSFFSAYFTTTGTHTAILVCGANGILGVQAGDTGTTAAFDNISFKEVPGLHMLQSTSPARPLLSARVNFLTYTEDFSNAVWQKRGAVSVTPNVITAPDGALTADLISGIGAAGVDDFHSAAPALPQATGASLSLSFYVDKGASSGVLDVQSVAGPSGGHWTISLSSVASGWVRITDAHPAVTVLVPFTVGAPALNSGPFFSAASGGPLSLYMWGCQLELASTASDYQAILTDGSSYSSTGFPIAQLYDGVDDGMATAAFAAGTLIDGMDCLIAVRRDSAAAMLCGLIDTPHDYWFGFAAPGSGSTANNTGCGTPTVWVDGAQLPGGTAVTLDAIASALTVGDWHILEYRNLDLSLWAKVTSGYYSGLAFNGPRGDILLYPSTDPTADKDAARQWLAAYYGVTLA